MVWPFYDMFNSQHPQIIIGCTIIRFKSGLEGVSSFCALDEWSSRHDPGLDATLIVPTLYLEKTYLGRGTRKNTGYLSKNCNNIIITPYLVHNTDS